MEGESVSTSTASVSFTHFTSLPFPLPPPPLLLSFNQPSSHSTVIPPIPAKPNKPQPQPRAPQPRVLLHIPPTLLLSITPPPPLSTLNRLTFSPSLSSPPPPPQGIDDEDASSDEDDVFDPSDLRHNRSLNEISFWDHLKETINRNVKSEKDNGDKMQKMMKVRGGTIRERRPRQQRYASSDWLTTLFYPFSSS